MAAPKMTMALASLLLSGAFATTQYCEHPYFFNNGREQFHINLQLLTDSSLADSQSTVTVETQQIGTTTSNGSFCPPTHEPLKSLTQSRHPHVFHELLHRH